MEIAARSTRFAFGVSLGARPPIGAGGRDLLTRDPTAGPHGVGNSGWKCGSTGGAIGED